MDYTKVQKAYIETLRRKIAITRDALRTEEPDVCEELRDDLEYYYAELNLCLINGGSLFNYDRSKEINE